MKKTFGVISLYFSLLQAFATECEKIGWTYHSDFTPLSGKAFEDCPDLYFNVDWDKPLDFRFSLSNAPEPTFSLPEDWDKALQHAKTCFHYFKKDEWSVACGSGGC